MRKIYTAESVTEGHPDKLCDIIADSVLDECLRHDALSRVACEVMATQGKIIVAGEITSKYEPHIPEIVRKTLSDVGYEPDGVQIEVRIQEQSSDIAAAVDNSLELRTGIPLKNADLRFGAGDQGVMIGYACKETLEMLPMPVVLARQITDLLTFTRKSGDLSCLRPDGKAQVSVEYEDDRPVRLEAVALSAQHKDGIDMDWLRYELSDKVLFPALRVLPPDENTRILINPSGNFVIGGIDADTGLTGRKLAVDAYGTLAPLGGGAFSGKDATKVDRSGAYMARYIAKNLVAAGLASRCQVTLAYVIGVAEPVMVQVDTFGTGTACEDDCLASAIPLVFGLAPAQMIAQLDLLTPRYYNTAAGGHFGWKQFPWERTDKVDALRAAIL